MIPEIRRQEELPRLRPIKVFPETLALRLPIVVGPTAEVVFEGVPYSMPPKATHVAGTLFLYEDRLRIVAGRFEVEHRRRRKGERPAPLPEHRAAKLAAVHGARAKLYEKRQQVLNLGSDALALLTEELYALLERHGDEVLGAAISQAVQQGRLSVAAVRRFSLRATEGAMAPAIPPEGRHRAIKTTASCLSRSFARSRSEVGHDA